MLMIPVSFPRPLINKSVRKTWRGKCFHLSMTTFQRRVLDIWASFSSWLPGGFSFGFAACVHVLLMIVSIAVVGISHAAAAAAAAVQQHQQAKLTNETKEKRDHRPSFHLEAAASFHVDPVGLLLLSFFFCLFLKYVFTFSATLNHFPRRLALDKSPLRCCAWQLKKLVATLKVFHKTKANRFFFFVGLGARIPRGLLDLCNRAMKRRFPFRKKKLQ